MSIVRRLSKTKSKKVLLFTRYYPARRFGMNMPKSRELHAKIPSPKAIFIGFLLVTAKVLNSYERLF